jgi:hypothetical protein
MRLRAANQGVVLLMKKLRVLLVCLTLQMGVVFGVPMRPDEIQELMHQMNLPKLAHVVRSESDNGDE